MRILLDHSIVGISATTLTIRKDREFAACRICGAIFQPRLNTDTNDLEYAADPLIAVAASIEIKEWRSNHNKKHTEHEHLAFVASGLTLTPEAAYRLAPFGLVATADALDSEEVAQAMLEAPRAPMDDVESTPKVHIQIKKGI
jgi:hypothetical protein